jgi:chaperone BCS1
LHITAQLTPLTACVQSLHSSDKNVLADLIECAHQKYLENGISRVTVHMTDNVSSTAVLIPPHIFLTYIQRGEWAKTVTKTRRALSTLILPSDIKEMILADAKEFLASEDWYKMAGIPHRRGRSSFAFRALLTPLQAIYFV